MISILKNRTFLLFFLGNITSLIGFGFNLIAVSWLVLSETGSEFALGKIIATATIPGLFISLFTGYIIDKTNRKWLMVFLDIFRLSVILIFLLTIQFYEFSISYLYPVVFFIGIGNSLFWSTSQAFTQEIVTTKEYFNANKLLSASFQIGSILGASVGGFIVHFYNPFTALWINILAYLISGILISLAPFKTTLSQLNTQNIFKSFLKGFSFLKERFDITMLSTTTILSDVAIWGSLSVLTISISTEIFDKGTWGYGFLDGLYGVGAFLSVFIVGYLTSNWTRISVLQGCYFLGFLSLYLSSIMPNIFFASIFFFILGININSSRIITRTILMENIDNKIMGRVQTVLGIYSRLMVVLSSLITGYIIENFSINTAVYFACMHYFAALCGITIVGIVWNKSKEYLFCS
tara:strand:+ start:2179 stop:3399 length:1221 start_codon:yes stop_codon:yes gene_type:complete